MPGSRARAASSVSLSESRLSGSAAPASTSSTASPSARNFRTAATASSTPLLRSMRPTSATASGGPGGSGSAAKCPVSTPEPGISAMRAGSMPNSISAARFSGFCTTMRPPLVAKRSAQPSARGRQPAPPPVNSIPSPITADTTRRRRNPANRAATPPNSTGLSAT